MHSASIEFHSGASLCRISRCNLFLHWSCSWPPFLLHSRNRPARLQRIEMCQSRHSAPGSGNASKAALLGQPRITAPNLFIPVTFVGYPLIPPRVRESKSVEETRLDKSRRAMSALPSTSDLHIRPSPQNFEGPFRARNGPGDPKGTPVCSRDPKLTLAMP